MKTDRQRAQLYLETRWEEQAILFPSMRNDIPKRRYVTVNLRYVLSNEERMIILRKADV